MSGAQAEYQDIVSLGKEGLFASGSLRSGWALWNFRGSFGILDTDRAGTKFKNWHGHRLDHTLLTMLQRKMQNSQGQS